MHVRTYLEYVSSSIVIPSSRVVVGVVPLQFSLIDTLDENVAILVSN